MKRTLLAGLPGLGLTLTEAQTETLCRFGEELLAGSQVMNLTAIRDPEGVANLHFLDSLALLNVTDPRDKTVLDVGCGAGFPGVPLKIGQPSLRLTLLDSLGKRMTWLERTLADLGVEAQVVCARAEEYAKDHREAYDVVTSRAVARLNVLSELCLPLTKVGGAFLAMKGARIREELEEAACAIDTLGAEVERVAEYAVAGATHYAAVIRKVRPTPGAYPRAFAKIKQKPL